MVWVKFTENFEWWPSKQVTISYTAGQVLNVTRRCAKAAKDAGKAVNASRPRPQGGGRP